MPDAWRSERPTDAQLATPFGPLWSLVRQASDPRKKASLVFELNAAADTLGLAALP